MMHFEWTQRGQAPHLPQMIESLERHGGAIVQYEIIFSGIMFSRTTTHLEWVPPYRSRSGAGFKYALWSLAIGWWSLPGLVLTPIAIVNNLLGGTNVTGIVAPGVNPAATATLARKQLKAAESRFGLMVLGMFLLILSLITLIAIYG
jgi:hypothetical protein